MASSAPLTAFQRLRDLAASGDLERFCQERNVRLLVTFGSVLDPERAHQARDLDLAVSWVPDSPRDLFGLIVDLMELLGLSAVDVMDLDRAGAVAREQALAYGIPLVETEPGLFARMQMAAVAERMDTAWLRRLRLEALAG